MAASNLVVKLLLDSGAFDKNIKTAKASIEGFEKVGKNIVGTLGKFAGAIGIATTASAAFEKIIRGSQATSDAFDRTMHIATTTVNNFFTAISTGDFGAFNDGLDNMIRRAKNAYDAIDQLGNTLMAYNVKQTRLKNDINNLFTNARDETLPMSARTADYQLGKEKIDELKATVALVKQDRIRALKAIVAAGIGVDPEHISEEALRKAIEVNADPNREYEFAFNKERLNALDAEKLRITRKHSVSSETYNPTANRWETTWTTPEENRQKISDEIQKIMPAYTSAKVMDYFLGNITDKELEKAGDGLSQAYLAELNITTLERQAQRVGKTLKENITSVTKTGETKVEEQPLYGSLKYFSEEIEKLTKEANNINLEVDKDKYDEVMAKIKKLQLERDALLKVGINQVEIPDLTDTSWMEDMEFEITPVKKEAIEANYDYADSINAIASVMGSLSQMTEDNASQWLNWASSVLTATASAVESIKKLVTAKTAEAAANAGAEVAKTPVIGWLLTGAAIASVLASFAAIPKFAHGGVVNSPFGVGDRVLARVNGGEMILNKHQQNNLFNLLDNGVTGANNKVTFEIEGKKLVGVINNYNNRMSKLR